VKLYKRKVNSGMAAALVLMYRWHERHGADRDFDTHDLLFRGRRLDADFAKLRFWGLISRAEVVNGGDGHPRRGSKYRITDLGRGFVRKRVVIQKYVYLYNDKLVIRDVPDDTTTDIVEALGDKFNYEELMAATPERTTV
jgi:hypothetical protein